MTPIRGQTPHAILVATVGNLDGSRIGLGGSDLFSRICAVESIECPDIPVSLSRDVLPDVEPIDLAPPMDCGQAHNLVTKQDTLGI